MRVILFCVGFLSAAVMGDELAWRWDVPQMPTPSSEMFCVGNLDVRSGAQEASVSSLDTVLGDQAVSAAGNLNATRPCGVVIIFR